MSGDQGTDADLTAHAESPLLADLRHPHPDIEDVGAGLAWIGRTDVSTDLEVPADRDARTLPRTTFRLALRFAFALTLTLFAPVAHADPYTLTPADRTEIEHLLRTFFEAARDGNRAVAAATIPTHEEFVALFQPGTEPFIERHQLRVEQDVRDLRERFAHGAWVGLSGDFMQNPSVTFVPCSRFARDDSRCVTGPVLDWRVGTEVQHLRIDRLVRLGTHWKIYDPRL